MRALPCIALLALGAIVPAPAATVTNTNDSGAERRKVSGILQLEQNEGEGFFLTDSESLPFTFGN